MSVQDMPRKGQDRTVPACLQPAVGAGLGRGEGRESKVSMSYFGSGQREALGQPE